MKTGRIYDPDHDALWDAVHRLTGWVIVLGLAVVAVAVAVLL